MAKASRERGESSPAPVDLTQTASEGVTTPPVEPLDDEVLRLEWSRFENLRFVAAGGVGRVYRAKDRRLDREVALKFLHGDTPEQSARLLREARAQAQIDHPNVCKIFEIAEAAGKPYLVMPFIVGRTLKDLAPELSLEAKVRLVKDVARGVHEAHRVGLIHQDLKPSNIMVEENPETGELQAYLMDFGSAVPTAQSGGDAGTPRYMAPEQLDPQHPAIDRRTDVWALGATLFECVSGTPFNPATTREEARRTLDALSPRRLREASPSAPRDLDDILARALQRERGQRYPSARALADDLQRFLDGEPISAPARSRLDRGRRFARRNRGLLSGAMALALVGAGLAAFWLRERHRAAEREHLAQALGLASDHIEAEMRFAHMLPRHDIETDRARLAADVSALEQRIHAAGALADGIGDHALGRAYLALGRLEDARAHLERAGAAPGAAADINLALGLVNGRLYDRALARVGALGSAAERASAQADAAQRYRASALRHLRATSESGGAAASLAGAMLASYAGETDLALERAREAFAREPWRYEAKGLEAQVRASEANALRDRGRWAEARAAYVDALAAYAAALAVGDSDEDLHAGACAAATDFLFEEVYGEGGDPKAAYQRMTGACEHALVVDPSSADAASQLSRGLKLWATQLLEAGEDPRPTLELAATFARRAMKGDDDVAHGLNALGNVYRLQGEWEAAHGLAARASLEQAVGFLRDAAEKAPGRAYVWNNLGNAYAALAELDLGKGGVPDSATRALEAYDRSIAVGGDHASPYLNAGLLRTRLAEVRSDVGQSPDDDLDAATALLTHAKSLDGSAPVLTALVDVAMVRAWHALASGQDPRPAFDAAREALDQLPAELEGSASVQLRRGEARLLQARLHAGAAQRALAAEAVQLLSKAPEGRWRRRLDEARGLVGARR